MLFRMISFLPVVCGCGVVWCGMCGVDLVEDIYCCCNWCFCLFCLGFPWVIFIFVPGFCLYFWRSIDRLCWDVFL
ncbi:hypothetical protein BZA05DRAFT_391048 [Tricharina praecox]|uniref:uncharacterized protein n=1 Tax=Tricharina praecox TaxID=43433 RepID=UPI0022208962|nr:uncharacterized protein BZA05DRAFT_391048 [Tricharina praecox]KAI5855262.1 hypothetical protein BZA05DRAFT_391048 [Tricharina praecox]